MKKLLFLTAIAVLTFNSSIAQEDTSSDEGISFGVKVGGNISNTSNGKEISDDGSTDNRYGFNVGAVVHIPISEKFSLQPEVVYSQQGFTTSSEFDLDLFGVSDIVYRLDYINIPIMASYQVVKGLTLQAGPQVGFNINAEVYNNDFDLDDDNDLSEVINTVDFGAGLGAQYELDFGLFFQARYVWGFSNYVDSEDADSSNRVGSLSVGYFFN